MILVVAFVFIAVGIGWGLIVELTRDRNLSPRIESVPQIRASANNSAAWEQDYVWPECFSEEED